MEVISISGILLICLGVILFMLGIFLLFEEPFPALLPVIPLIVGFGLIFGGIKLLSQQSSNPPYRFKTIPVHKTIDTLYNSVETKGDTITITTKLLKLKD